MTYDYPISLVRTDGTVQTMALAATAGIARHGALSLTMRGLTAQAAGDTFTPEGVGDLSTDAKDAIAFAAIADRGDLLVRDAEARARCAFILETLRDLATSGHNPHFVQAIYETTRQLVQALAQDLAPQNILELGVETLSGAQTLVDAACDERDVPRFSVEGSCPNCRRSHGGDHSADVTEILGGDLDDVMAQIKAWVDGIASEGGAVSLPPTKVQA